MLAKGQLEFYRFEGDGAAINGTLNAAAVVDVSSSYVDMLPGVVDITDTAHGYLAGDGPKVPNYIFIQGTTNYDGLRRILSVPDVNSLYIIAKYVAETLATADTIFPGLQFDEPWEFVGFKLHVDATPATAENFTITVDAAAGVNFDVNIYTRDMNGVTDLIWIADKPIPIRAKDIVKCAWANANANGWGLELIAQRLS